MRFLDFFKKKSYSTMTLNESIQQKICEFVRPPLGSQYNDKNSVDKYRSWVYVSANHNARNVADGEVKLYTNVAPKASKSKTITKPTLKEIRSYGLKAHQDTKEVENHPIIDLLHTPNPRDTFYDLIYKTDLFLELTGDAYWLLTRDGNGIPTEIDVLYSQFVNIQHDATNKITAYNYGVAIDGVYQYNFAPEDIIHFKFFDPADLFHGISPLHACARSYGLIESMDTHEEALNRNLGIPSGVIKYNSQKLRPEDRAIVEQKWNKKFAGVGRSGKVVVTDQDIDYDAIGITPREMNFLDGRKWSREEIFACYGINPALMLTEDVNRSNMVVASVNYYKNTLKPRWKLLSQTITRRLLEPNGLNGSDVFITISKESPQDDELVIKKSQLLVNGQAITVNELREQLGLDLLDDDYGLEIVGINRNDINNRDEQVNYVNVLGNTNEN
jgi:HK97 family phage portal protein